MKLDVRDRGLGKTHDAILRCMEEIRAGRHTYIVCANRQRCRQVVDQAAAMGLHIPYPLIFHSEFMGGRRGHHYPYQVIIDDLDACIQQNTSIPILYVTMTKDESACQTAP